MRLPLRCVLLGTILTVVLTGLLLFTFGTASSASFVLLLPAIRITTAILGPVTASSDSGPVNFIAIVLIGSVLNIGLYAVLFNLLSKIPVLVRRTRSTNSSKGS
jgi:hypothetical protein